MTKRSSSAALASSDRLLLGAGLAAVGLVRRRRSADDALRRIAGGSGPNANSHGDSAIRWLPDHSAASHALKQSERMTSVHDGPSEPPHSIAARY